MVCSSDEPLGHWWNIYCGQSLAPYARILPGRLPRRANAVSRKENMPVSSGSRLQLRRRIGPAVLRSRGYIIAVANGRVCVIQKWGRASAERQGHLPDRRVAGWKDHLVGCDLALGEPVKAVVGLAIAGQAAPSFPIVPGAPNRIDAGRGSIEGQTLAKPPHTQRMNFLPRHGDHCSQTADILTIPCPQ